MVVDPQVIALQETVLISEMHGNYGEKEKIFLP